jgi:Cu-Zn family superoxide dismutase
VVSAIILAAVVSCQKLPLTATADIVTLNGESAGSVHMIETPEGVKIHLNLKNLPPGMHALHIHEKGDFTPPDFKAAGAHYNPAHKMHGMKNPHGPHAGDLPNIEVAKDGTCRVELVSKTFTLEKGKPNSILREGGTSIIIHESADNNVSDPAGKSGARIAGGIIKAH